jgi:hypothetical protein
MLTRETLKANGAVSVSAIAYDGSVHHGYWHDPSCFLNECWTEVEPNNYIQNSFSRIMLDNGYRYTEYLYLVEKRNPL